MKETSGLSKQRRMPSDLIPEASRRNCSLNNKGLQDESFIRSGNVQRFCAKRRFTLAHECAHQILFQLESDEVKTSCEMKYSARTAYTPRELKTREDWNEWQANVLGAAIVWCGL